MVWALENSKSTHSNRAMSPKPSQIVPTDGDQTFKHEPTGDILLQTNTGALYGTLKFLFYKKEETIVKFLSKSKE